MREINSFFSEVNSCFKPFKPLRQLNFIFNNNELQIVLGNFMYQLDWNLEYADISSNIILVPVQMFLD